MLVKQYAGNDTNKQHATCESTNFYFKLILFAYFYLLISIKKLYKKRSNRKAIKSSYFNNFKYINNLLCLNKSSNKPRNSKTKQKTIFIKHMPYIYL